MQRRLDSTGLMAPDQVSYMRFLERKGGFASQQTLGLVAWQAGGTGFEFIQSGPARRSKGCPEFAPPNAGPHGPGSGGFHPGLAFDLASRPTAWHLSAANEPSRFLTAELQHTGRPAWVTVALAYTKELETIAARRSEPSGKTPNPPKPPPEQEPLLQRMDRMRP